MRFKASPSFRGQEKHIIIPKGKILKNVTLIMRKREGSTSFNLVGPD